MRYMYEPLWNEDCIVHMHIPFFNYVSLHIDLFDNDFFNQRKFKRDYNIRISGQHGLRRSDNQDQTQKSEQCTVCIC